MASGPEQFRDRGPIVFKDRGIIPSIFRRREQKGPEYELYELSDEAIEVLRDAYVMEGPHRKLVDFDLVPVSPRDRRALERRKKWHQGPPTKREWTEIVGSIDELRSRAERIILPRNGKTAALQLQREFLLAELIAHSTFYRGKTNQEFPFEEFISLTQGIRPQMIEESTLMAQIDSITKGFGAIDSESIERYRREHLVSEETLPDKMRDYVATYLGTVSDFLGKKITPELDIEAVKEDDYWIDWIDGDHERFSLKINTHPVRHASRWTEGKVEAMAAHEIAGHAAQMESWKNAIDRGELLRVLGLTSVHYPGQIPIEGFAQTVHLFVPSLHRHFSEHTESELELEGLRQMIYNNIHIMVNTTGSTDEEMIAYMHRFLPAEPEDEIRNQIQERRDDPVKRTYLYAYGIGFRLHQWYAGNLTIEGKRELLRFIFSQSTTPEQEYHYFLQLVSDRSGRYGSIRAPFSDSQTLPSFIDNSSPSSYTLPHGAAGETA